ncbi:MAG: hypothetical protein WD175_02435 [Candidatus Paceibacterota bacterium]
MKFLQQKKDRLNSIVGQSWRSITGWFSREQKGHVIDPSIALAHLKGSVLIDTLHVSVSDSTDTLHADADPGQKSGSYHVELEGRFTPSLEQCSDEGITGDKVLPESVMLEVITQAVMAAVVDHLDLEGGKVIKPRHADIDWSGEVPADFRFIVTIPSIELSPDNTEVFAKNIIGEVSGARVVTVSLFTFAIIEQQKSSTKVS